MNMANNTNDAPSMMNQLFEMLCECDAYLRDIRAENLDGSEPNLGELLERSLTLRLDYADQLSKMGQPQAGA